MDKEEFRIACAVALNNILGDNPRLSHSIIESLGSPEALFRLTEREREELFISRPSLRGRFGARDLEEAGELCERLCGYGYGIVTLSDPHYPALLRECPDAPVALYVRSATPAAELFGTARPAISVVGTRDISPYGRDLCRNIAQALSESPVRPVIVSGLAIGVDITVQMEALRSGLATIGVSPVGIDEVYPRRHSVAAASMAAAPASGIVTDFPPGTPVLRSSFLRRNRIIAGLSQATILVESRLRGGGIMTARLASGYGRALYALPGRVDDSRSCGCNTLIRTGMAEAVSDIAMLPSQLGLGKAARHPARSLESVIQDEFAISCPDAEITALTALARAVTEHRGIDLDGLCAHLGCSYGKVARLSGLLFNAGIINIDLLQRCTINTGFY